MLPLTGSHCSRSPDLSLHDEALVHRSLGQGPLDIHDIHTTIDSNGEGGSQLIFARKHHLNDVSSSETPLGATLVDSEPKISSTRRRTSGRKFTNRIYLPDPWWDLLKEKVRQQLKADEVGYEGSLDDDDTRIRRLVCTGDILVGGTPSPTVGFV